MEELGAQPSCSCWGRVPQATLDRAAADPRFLAAYRGACDRYNAYLERSEPAGGQLIAYFSMEYGLVECMPIYSGGLGVLAGDHLKAASDAGIPLVAVGLLYHQRGVPAAGAHQSRWLATGAQSRQRLLHLAGAACSERAGPGLDGGSQAADREGFDQSVVPWMSAGMKLYLLDTNIPENVAAGTSRKSRTSCTAAMLLCVSGKRSCWGSVDIALYRPYN